MQIKKKYGFAKSERLCNFRLKKNLFAQGKHFHSYPFKVIWKTLDHNLESTFFDKSPYTFSPNTTTTSIRIKNNPSYPHIKIPDNAVFEFPAKLLIAVSKKTHKTAPKRNHIKRMIREAYRINKHKIYSFLEQENKILIFAFIYTSKTIHPFEELKQKIVVSLQKLEQEISKENAPD